MSEPNPKTDGDAAGSSESSEALDEMRDVTAPPGPTPAWRSDESAGLRETWLAFGDLLEAATPTTLDQRALVEAVRARDARHGFGLSWRSIAAAAGGLAAAVAIAVAVGRSMREGGAPEVSTRVATSQQSVATEVSQRPAPPPPPPGGRRGHAVASTRPEVIEIAWDDQIGARLEPVRRAVRRLQAAPDRHADRVDNLRARMNALQLDLRDQDRL